LLFKGNFISGTVRAWSGIGDLSWDSQTWTGTGTLLTISSVEEKDEISANGITVSLAGIPSSMISLALSDCKQGAAGYVYLGFLDGSSVVSDPILLFEGKLDIPAISENPETSTISISYESRLIDLERPRENRYTDEDQQRLFVGDLGLQFVPSLQDLTLTWGKATASSSGGGKVADTGTFDYYV
jgi:hypothetical protein